MKISRAVLAGIFLVGGLAHLTTPSVYRSIMPPVLPAPGALIAISGVAEIAGGLGLLLPRTRRASGVGLILLLVAVFPANIQMLHVYRDRGVPWWGEAMLWLRLPLQAVLVWWVWRVSLAFNPRRTHQG